MKLPQLIYFTALIFSCKSGYAGIVEMPEVVESSSLHGSSVYENINIPSMRYRNPDTETGPRLWVKEIRLQGIGDYPELGIYRKDIIKHIETRRQAVMREDKLRAHGYTDEEIAEILNLLNELDNSRKFDHVTTPDLQKFIWLVREQKERRGLSLGEIENIAFEVEEYYRDRGMGLVKAFVPRQAMRDGVLVITVLNGKLGTIEVLDNERYSDEIIRSVFLDVMYKPVKFDVIEERMFLLNDLPGLNISGAFEAGDQVGDTRLNLSVRTENEFDHTVRLDNHGADSTGKFRAFYQFYWNNPAHIADQLSLALLQSSTPDNSTYGLIGYRAPIWNKKLFAGISVSSNQFAIDQSTNTDSTVSQIGINGETQQAELVFDYSILRSRETSWWTYLVFNTTKTILDSDEFGNLGLDDKIKNIRLRARFDILDTENKVLHLGSFGATSGRFDFGQIEGQSEDYYKFNADYSRLSFFTIPWTEVTTRIILRSELQYTDQPLPAAEQSALAGPTVVRAFPINQFSGDSALYLGLEWVFNTPELLTFDYFITRNLAQKMQPFFFLNVSHGIQYALIGDEDKDASLADAGLGIQYAYGSHISGNLQVAFPLEDKFSDDSISVPDDAYKLVFDFQYRF